LGINASERDFSPFSAGGNRNHHIDKKRVKNIKVLFYFDVPTLIDFKFEVSAIKTVYVSRRAVKDSGFAQ
jgi:hypothetical protein